MATLTQKLDKVYRPVSRTEAPSLHAAVDELCKKAGIEKPTICFIDSATIKNGVHKLNMDWQASAMHMDKPRLSLGPKVRELFGHHHGSSHVSDELKAILAHEITHLRQNDPVMWKMHAWRNSPFALATGAIVGTWYYQHLKDVEAKSRAEGKSEDAIKAETKALWEASAPDPKDDLGVFGVNDPAIAAARAIAGGLLGLTSGFGLYALHNRHIEFRADRGGAELMGSGKPLAKALKMFNNAGAQAFERIPKQVIEEYRKMRGSLGLIYDSLSHPPTKERIDRLVSWSH